jgi:tetratricopeptide (TPR) repeat protein
MMQSFREGLEAAEHEALTPLYEQALEADPDDLDSLIWLGNAYTRQGRIEDGLRVDLKLTALLPADPTVRYNLACSYALLGRTDEALDEMERAVRLGYRDAEHMRRDEDLTSLRGESRFLRLLRELEA